MKDELEEYWENQIENYKKNIIDTPSSVLDSNSGPFDSINFPIVKKVFVSTLGSDGWVKSKKQQLKEDRINKLRQLQGEEPNVILPEDEYVEGLISVQPLSAPIGKLFYMDYKY